MFKNLLNSISSIPSKFSLREEELITNKNGEWWLYSQAIIIAAHFLPSYPEKSTTEINIFITTISIALIILAFVLSIRSILSLGSSFSPFPKPRAGKLLVRIGAYRFCRHPLYQAMLIASFGISLYLLSLIHLFLFISLCMILRAKAIKEEEFLDKLYPEYYLYRKKTIAILPLINYLDWRN
tara:strand:- start:459 stop:1004 length:546 start_codon:yes stop_codon:yes gene_type:complete